MQITTVGLDLAKNVFHLIGLNQAQKEVIRKRLRRAHVKRYFANLPPCRVAMKACGSAHYWGRELRQLGHEVKLIPAQAVKAYVQGNKNDYNDALAIAEAANRPKMRFVRIKTTEQQDTQALHRLRDGAVSHRNKVCNRIRGLLAEYGILMARGVVTLRKAIPELLGDGDHGLSDNFRRLLQQAYRQLQELDAHIHTYDHAVKQQARENEAAKRLMSIPGYRLVVSSVYLSAAGDGSAFRRGREVSAYIGLVPRQHSTGDKSVLLGIRKRGHRQLRTLLIHGARAVVRYAPEKDDALSRWVTTLVVRRGKHKATVALANKLARIGWAVLTRGEVYQPTRGSASSA